MQIELSKVIQRRDRTIIVVEAMNDIRPVFTPTEQYEGTLEEVERKHIKFVLDAAQTLEEAAGILGINLSTLWRKRRTYGLE